MGGTPTQIDVFGPTNGDDFEQVTAAARDAQLGLDFRGGRDHSDKELHAYRVFVNPSKVGRCRIAAQHVHTPTWPRLRAHSSATRSCVRLRHPPSLARGHGCTPCLAPIHVRANAPPG